MWDVGRPQIAASGVARRGLWQGRRVLLVETFPAGPLLCNCTVLACADTRDAIIVDPGGETERIAEITALLGATETK